MLFVHFLIIYTDHYILGWHVKRLSTMYSPKPFTVHSPVQNFECMRLRTWKRVCERAIECQNSYKATNWWILKLQILPKFVNSHKYQVHSCSIKTHFEMTFYFYLNDLKNHDVNLAIFQIDQINKKRRKNTYTICLNDSMVFSYIHWKKKYMHTYKLYHSWDFDSYQFNG